MQYKILLQKETAYMMDKINLERDKEFHKWEHYFHNVNNIPDECNLFVEVFPYYYISVPRRGEFMLMFNSNCMRGKKFFF